MSSSINIVRKPVASGNVKSIGYDDDSRTLEVEFGSGAVYRYSAVPKSVYLELVGSPSVGKKLNDTVKGIFDCVRMPDEVKSGTETSAAP